MLFYLSKLKVADNSGVRELQCIKVIGGSVVKKIKIGSSLIVVIKKIVFGTKRLTRGMIVKALIVRTKFNFYRACGIWLKFNQNSVVIINKRFAPRGKRLFGPMLKEICIKYNFLGTVTKFII